MPDDEWKRLFKELGSNRDRAIVSVSTDIDWGSQLIRVIRKGSRAEQWLPVSPEAIV
ncbi:hypothetical protein [Glycomyces tritici]|uniref:Uncharacterized protein n=1 Tax=Glycomyces tritici TaxID=2665176 RepID=A0ABT7YWM7_9ACTN|nr:hypothetical protein [Glycomyces tritici]MDN3243051.1 hypothetical protein [Glycomyces tritici]